MEGFSAYQKYLAVMSHLNSKNNYDISVYKGRVNVSLETFSKRPDKWVFGSLERKYTPEPNMLIYYFAAVIMEMGFVKTRQLTSRQAMTAFDKWQRRMFQLPEEFEKAVKFLSEKYGNDIREIFKNGDGSHPRVFTHLIQGDYSEEVYMALDVVYPFTDELCDYVDDPILWDQKYKELNRKKYFLKFDSKELKGILDKYLWYHYD